MANGGQALGPELQSLKISSSGIPLGLELEKGCWTLQVHAWDTGLGLSLEQCTDRRSGVGGWGEQVDI